MADAGSGSGALTRSRSGIVLLCFLAVIGFLLLTEHRVHVLGLLPYALLLLCPLLHMFHHGGHGGDGRPGSPQEIHETTPRRMHHREGGEP